MVASSVSAMPTLIRVSSGVFVAGMDTNEREWFHGTHPEDKNVAPICRDGIHDYQGFTNFFHYAVRRSEGKQSYDGDAKVLAMAVIVEAEDRLGWKDAKIRTPGREYALPLFVVTVRCN